MLQDTIQEMITESPWKMDSMIARKAGVSKWWVGQQRKKMGMPPSYIVRRQLIRELVSQNPKASAECVLEELYEKYGIITSNASVYRVKGGMNHEE